jgi:hypothetical protein
MSDKSSHEMTDKPLTLPQDVSQPAALLIASLQHLSKQDQQALMKKAAELGLKVTEAGLFADQKHIASQQQLSEFVHQVTSLERKARGDITADTEVEGGAGPINIKYTKKDQLIVIVIAIAVAVLAFIILSR